MSIGEIVLELLVQIEVTTLAIDPLGLLNEHVVILDVDHVVLDVVLVFVEALVWVEKEIHDENDIAVVFDFEVDVVSMLMKVKLHVIKFI